MHSSNKRYHSPLELPLIHHKSSSHWRLVNVANLRTEINYISIYRDIITRFTETLFFLQHALLTYHGHVHRIFLVPIVSVYRRNTKCK